MQIAKYRNATDKIEISMFIKSLAVKVGQLCSVDVEYAQVEYPFTKLLTSYLYDEVFKCDLLGQNFDKTTVPGFSFKDQWSVQVGEDLYATSFENC